MSQARVQLDAFTSLAFFFHKLLRWVLPFLMMALLLSSAALWDRPFYLAALLVQLLFYGWAAAGYVFRDRMAPLRYGLIGYFLLAINVAFLVGFVRFLYGHQEVKWKRAA